MCGEQMHWARELMCTIVNRSMKFIHVVNWSCLCRPGSIASEAAAIVRWPACRLVNVIVASEVKMMSGS